MSRREQRVFVDTDAAPVEEAIEALYARTIGTTVRPGSPEKLFCRVVAYWSVYLLSEINRAGNRNLPSTAEGEDLDILGSELYMLDRPEATPAVCTERFYISEAQQSSVLIPRGTRVTDAGSVLTWETVEDAYVEIGGTYADVQVRCQTAGTAGNGYGAGQINTFVDLYDYCSRCENLTVSDGGSDVPDDDAYYELMRASLDRYSTAGAVGSYIYWAKSVSSHIADVVANSPSAATVALYLLMDDGTLATEEVKREALEACSDQTRRPLTDKVITADADTVSYDITFTYYIQSNSPKSAAAIKADVDAAVKEYVAWQAGKFGRDINPDKLREYLAGTGIKRIVLTAPEFTVLHTGSETDEGTGYAKYKPQLAKVGTVTVTSGGYEDE